MENTHLCLIKLGESEPPIFIVREYWSGDWEGAEYHFEHKQCPSDTLGGQVIYNGDVDPHQIMELIEVAPKPDDWPFIGVVNWDRYRALFSKLPEALEDAA